MRRAERPLGEVVELKRGYDLPARQRRPGAVPVVSSGGVTGNHDTARAAAPGVVTGRTGTLGRVFFLERDFWPLNTTLYVKDFKGNDPRYVAYLLESLDVSARNDKAAVPGVHREQLHAISVSLPPLPEQRRRGRALAALDRRLDLLDRQNRTLAALSHTAFRAARADWRRRSVPLAALCDVGHGATPPRGRPAYFAEWGVDWYRSGELSDGPLVGARRKIVSTRAAEWGGTVWDAGTVLCALYAAPTAGRLGLLAAPGSANQACAALLARKGAGPHYLFHALLETRERLRRSANGAVQQNLDLETLRRHTVPHPGARAAGEFDRWAQPLHARAAQNLRERNSLAALRDALVTRVTSAGWGDCRSARSSCRAQERDGSSPGSPPATP